MKTWTKRLIAAFVLVPLAALVPLAIAQNTDSYLSANHFNVLETKANGTNLVNVQAPNLASTWTWTVPGDDGTAGQFMQTDGNGISSWTTVFPAAGVVTSTGTAFTSGGTDAGDAAINTTQSSAAAPTYSFIGSLDNGLYLPQDDQVGLVTDGVQRLNITDTGVVRIPDLSAGGPIYSATAGALHVETFLDRTRGGTGISSTATFPSSGVVVTEAASQSLTNKKLGSLTTNGPIYTSGGDGTLNSEASLAIARGGTSGATATAGFNALSPLTTKGDLVTRDGTNNVRQGVGVNGQVLMSDSAQTNGIKWGDIGGGGSGEINAISNPSAASATTGWAVTGTATITRLTASAPLDPVITTGLRCASGSAADYCKFDFTLPSSLLSKKLKIEWHQLAPTAGDWKVEMKTQAGVAYALSTDSSSVSAIPALTGKYTTTFDADSTSTLSLRFVRVAGSGNLDIANVIVGPGIQPQGAVVGEWQSYTPTVAGLGTGTTSANLAKWRRVGDSMQVVIHYQENTVGSGASTVTWSLPTGYTFDTAKLTGTVGSGHDNIGSCQTYQIVASAQVDRLVQVAPITSTTVGVFKPLTAGFYIGSEVVANSQWNLEFFAPVAEFAGSGTVNVVQNDVEYAYNSSTTDADDTTSFAYGPGGGQFGNFTAERLKRVSFQTPIQVSDSIVLQITADSGVTWHTVGQNNAIVSAYETQNSVTYGVQCQSQGASTVTVNFGQYRRNFSTTYGGAGTAWSTIDVDPQYKYRVVKTKGGQAVGFGNVAQSTSGLVKSAGQLLGTNTNDVAAVGYVGEYVIGSRLRTSGTGLTSTNVINVASISLTAGDWDLAGIAGYQPTNSATSITQLAAGISLTSATMPAVADLAVPTSNELRMLQSFSAQIPTIGQDLHISMPAFRVTLTATTTLYLVSAATFTVSTLEGYGALWARRMR